MFFKLWLDSFSGLQSTLKKMKLDALYIVKVYIVKIHISHEDLSQICIYLSIYMQMSVWRVNIYNSQKVQKPLL